MLKRDIVLKLVILILIGIGFGVLFLYNPFTHTLKEILTYIFVNPLIVFSTIACYMIMGFRIYTEHDKTILRTRFKGTENLLAFIEKKEISALILTIGGFLGITCILSIRSLTDFLYLIIIINICIVNIHSFIYLMKFLFIFKKNNLAAFATVYISMFTLNFILKIPFGKLFGIDMLFIYSINSDVFILQSIFQLFISLVINETLRIIFYKVNKRQDIL